MKHSRNRNSSSPTELKPGDLEYEMGIPIPGTILDPSEWVQTALKKLPDDQSLDPVSLFGRSAPLAIEIGCGNGRFTISSAVRRSDWNHLALDILPAVIRYATRRGNQRGLSNVRFAVSDGWRFLTRVLPFGLANEIHIYHPQPYADPHEAGQRMMTPEFLGLLHRSLTGQGLLFLQTDRKAYWDYIRKTVSSLFDWQEIDEPWVEDPYGRSRREMLSLSQGLKIFRGIATKRDHLSDDVVQQICSSLPQPNFQIERPKGKQTWRRRR
jgi:tRNA (guanine-N7-)-methyltransferase